MVVGKCGVGAAGGSGKAVLGSAWMGKAVAGSWGADRRDFGGLSIRPDCFLANSLDAPAEQMTQTEMGIP